MKFTKQFPNKDGLYYYVDDSYPVPQVGFLYSRVGINWLVPLGKQELAITPETYKHYSWGSPVPLPKQSEVNVVSPGPRNML